MSRTQWRHATILHFLITLKVIIFFTSDFHQINLYRHSYNNLTFKNNISLVWKCCKYIFDENGFSVCFYKKYEYLTQTATNRSSPRQDRSRSKSRNRSKSRTQNHACCFYHKMYGTEARNCRDPCTYKSENWWKGGSQSASCRSQLLQTLRQRCLFRQTFPRRLGRRDLRNTTGQRPTRQIRHSVERR